MGRWVDSPARLRRMALDTALTVLLAYDPGMEASPYDQLLHLTLEQAADRHPRCPADHLATSSDVTLSSGNRWTLELVEVVSRAPGVPVSALLEVSGEAGPYGRGPPCPGRSQQDRLSAVSNAIRPAGRTVRPNPHRVVPVHGAHRGGQDRAGPGPGRVSSSTTQGHDPIDMSEYGERHSWPAWWGASGYVATRRGPAHRGHRRRPTRWSSSTSWRRPIPTCSTSPPGAGGRSAHRRQGRTVDFTTPCSS